MFNPTTPLAPRQHKYLGLGCTSSFLFFSTSLRPVKCKDCDPAAQYYHQPRSRFTAPTVCKTKQRAANPRFLDRAPISIPCEGLCFQIAQRPHTRHIPNFPD